MNLDGTTPTQLTFPAAGCADSQPQLTDNQQYLVFVSTRPTSNWSNTQGTAPSTNPDIWVAQTTPNVSSLSVVDTSPQPRFYPDAAITTNQLDPMVLPSPTNPDELLFVSANAASTTSDIFLGMAIDHQAPYVTSVATATPKVASPGDVITVTVPVVDADSGVAHVWLQIKSPDQKIMMPSFDTRTALNRSEWLDPLINDPLNGNVMQDNFDQNPLVNGLAPVDPWQWTDVPTQMPVDFQVLNPFSNLFLNYLDNNGNTILTNFPDYYSFATSDNSLSIYRTDSPTSIGCYSAGYCEEGKGYPAVPTYWIPMSDPNHTGTYSCQWQTPTTLAGDWYFDVIVEDSCPVANDPATGWHGYRRRFDNIGGCSTAAFTAGAHTILFVDEYGDGQRFMFYGVNGDIPAYVGPCFLSTPYYLLPEPVNPANPDGIAAADYTPLPSPLSAGGVFGGSDLWRILCRGPLSDQVLYAYLGPQVQQVSPLDGVTPVTVTHGDKEVFWLSPSTWYRLVASSPGTGFNGTGSMLDPVVQAQLQTFVQNGGRLFADGFDLPTGLTADHSVPSPFMQQVFGASMLADPTATGLYLWDDWSPQTANLSPCLGVNWNGSAANSVNTFSAAVFAVPKWFGEAFGDTPPLGQQGTPGGTSSTLLRAAGGTYPAEEGIYHEWPTGMYRVAHDANAADHAGRDKQHTHFQLIPNGNPNITQDQPPIGFGGNPSLYNLNFNFSNGEEYISAVQPAFSLTWDMLTPTGTGQEAFALWNVFPPHTGANNMDWFSEYTPNNSGYVPSPYVVGVSNDMTTGNGRTILFSFGLEQISASYRNRPLHDGLKWLLDGSIIGKVAQTNTLQPVVGALVEAEPTTVGAGPISAAHTDANGIYQLQGLHTGGYAIMVSANGYYGSSANSVSVLSQRVTNDGTSDIPAAQSIVTPDVDFFLYTNPQDNSTISGTVTLHGTPVGNNEVTVTAVPVGGTGNYSSATDAKGHYSITQLPVGTYQLTATDAINNLTASVQATIQNANTQLTQNIELAPHAPDLLVAPVTKPATAFIGGGIYNTTGANQTVTQTVNPSVMASYLVEVQNNSGTADSFNLYAPPGNTNWTVAYFDAPSNGTDITSQITSPTGWPTGQMAVGASKEILVEVTPGASATPSSGFNVPVTVSEVGTTTVLDEVIAATQVTGPLTSVTLTPSPASPQNMLTQITLTAQAGGGTSDVFQFVLDGTTILQDYSAVSTCTWVPQSPGTHTLIVNAEDTQGANPNAVVSSAPLSYVINVTTLTAATITATPASPVIEGTSVTLDGFANGGTNLQYRFLLQSGTTTTPLDTFSASSTYTWVPMVPGSYSLSVEVEDLGVTPAIQVTSPAIPFVVTTLPLTGVTLTATPANAQVQGSKVTLTANTNGGSENIYTFMDGFTTLVANSGSNTYTWAPTALGTHTFMVYVQDLGGQNPTQVFVSSPLSYVIAKPITGVQLSVQPASPQPINTTITLTAATTPAQGANVVYNFLINNVSQGFSSSATYTWTPTTAETYTLQVQAKDSSGVLQSSNVMNYTINNPLTGPALNTSPLSPAAASSPVTITANATGGVNLSYQFLVNGIALAAPGTSNSCAWTPPIAGTYSLEVIATDLGSIQATTLTASATYVVDPQLTQVALYTSPTPNQMLGTPIALTAVATGGANVVYQFWAGNALVSDYSPATLCTWTPQSTGSYTLSVKAKDLNGNLTTVTSQQITFVIASPLTAVTLSASPSSPSLANTPITLTATAAGGANPYYKFYDITHGITLQDYSPSPTCLWTPSDIGSYQLAVTVHDLHGSSSAPDVVSPTIIYVINPPASGVSLSANPPTQSTVNSQVVLTATATGGAQVNYRFMVGATILQDYSAAVTCTWTTPSVPGTYLLTVLAQAPGGPVYTATLNYIVTSMLSGISLSTSPAQSSTVNTPVQLTANAVGGANVKYQFWAYNPFVTPAWSQLQAYSAQSTYTWVPSAPGVYLLSATAQDNSTGPELNTTLWHTVTSATPLSAVTVTPSVASPQPVNTPINFTAAATGGANVQYQFWLYNPSATPAWSQLQAYSSLATCTWTPTGTGTYLLAVTARDGVLGTEVSSTVWYAISGSLTSVSAPASPASPQAAGTPITFTASPPAGRMCSTNSGCITRTPLRHGASCRRIPHRQPASGRRLPRAPT